MSTSAPTPQATTYYSIPVSDVTHVIIVTGYTSRLNLHIEYIEDLIRNQFNAQCRCLFVLDRDNTPNLYVPFSTPEKQEAAQSLINMIPANIKLNGSIAFELWQPCSGIICFDLIDLLVSTNDYCQPCGNVTQIHYIQDGSKKILVLAYDCIDA